MHQQEIDRRRFLLAASSLGSIPLAGCLGPGGSDDGQSDHEHEHTDGHEHDHGSESSNSHAHVEQVSAPIDHAEVAMRTDNNGHHFDPQLIWINPGGTVTWTNESGSHTTTAYHPDYDKPRRIPKDAQSWNSGMLSSPGAMFKYTFDVEGVYDYFCIPHEYRAMVGTVIVGSPDLTNQPGLTSPQSDLPKEAQTLLKKLNDEARQALEQK